MAYDIQNLMISMQRGTINEYVKKIPPRDIEKLLFKLNSELKFAKKMGMRNYPHSEKLEPIVLILTQEQERRKT